MSDYDDEDLEFDIDEEVEMTPGTAQSYRFDEDDAFMLDDDDGYGGRGEEFDAKDVEFVMLTEEEIVQEQEKEITRIVDIVGVTDSSAKVLLRKCGWKAERVLNIFFENGKEGLLKAAGLSENDLHDADSMKVSGCDTFECPLCYDDVPADQCTKLPACSHAFCNNCWKAHIESKIKEGKLQILCPELGCVCIVDDDLIGQFASSQNKKKFDAKFIESYVEDNVSIKWCPSVPCCGRCVRVNVPHTTPLEIDCKCGCSFCFNCLKFPHLPATCNMMTAWNVKCQSDSETFNWLAVNTKDCPKCNTPIEKNGGCNHMHCHKCQHHFCWVCLCDFNHTTYQHSCGRFEEKDTKSARASLERYLHYYNRYKAHEDSRKREEKTRDSIKKKMVEMFELRPNSAWIEVQWVEQAMLTLFNCRKGLQYSYVLSYYLFDPTACADKKTLEGCRELMNDKIRQSARNVTEDNIEMLENATEKLSNLLEKPVKDFFNENIKQDVMGCTVLCDSRLQSVFNVVREDLMISGEFGCPRPKSTVTTRATAIKAGQSMLSRMMEEEAAKLFKQQELEKQKQLSRTLGTDLDDIELQKAILESMK